jgi:hypothetical protein
MKLKNIKYKAISGLVVWAGLSGSGVQGQNLMYEGRDKNDI